MEFIVRGLLDAGNGAAGDAVGFNDLLGAPLLGIGDIDMVAKEEQERFVADEILCLVDSMTVAFGSLLLDIGNAFADAP